MTTQRPNGLPVILDVDTGIDDALALAYAVAQPGLDIVAVTTVAGNIDVYRATGNTRNVLAFLGREDVPVHRGATRPLTRAQRGASHVHGTDGLGGADLPESQRAIDVTPGPATIVRLARERPGELTLIAVGPLTNLAIALNVEPRVAEWIPRVVVMGGAYHVPGNITPHAEFNVWADPEAADQVCAAPFGDLMMLGLDVTMQVGLSREVWADLQQRTDRPAAGELAVRVGRQTFVDAGMPQMYLHDPLAVAVAVDPTLVTSETVRISVTTSGEEDGRTVSVGPGPTQVARGVDADRFLAGVHRALGVRDVTAQ
ncbi:MAG: Inosine-uridine preferring nucleoside hydrolase [uncultured Thermomicrobiales bacterium]|uniref:Inosine-uridine preferring nucleoside hydrolase n=1 Tax=uncultured Thermomicrobiales bacterium TaxID=1645740 RepID=A0A6J4V386_9BACT|nr:MAG: Inosine-uridine preferring nucleoside hydrolase [uncultured Thermomicrobiales bacterium]